MRSLWYVCNLCRARANHTCAYFVRRLYTEAEIAAASALPAGVTDSAGEYIIPPSDLLSAAIARAGLSDEPRLSLAGDEDRYLGFFEAHIEQGPFLEANGNSIGVVSACVGIFGGDISASILNHTAAVTELLPMPPSEGDGEGLSSEGESGGGGEGRRPSW